MRLKSFLKASLISLFLLPSFFSLVVFAEKVELECETYNLNRQEWEKHPTKYVFDNVTEKLFENWEVILNGVVMGRGNEFKTELASPSLIIATFREPNGSINRVRINRTTLEIQQIYRYADTIENGKPRNGISIYSKGKCKIKETTKPLI
jgi:hypothetical protein